MDTFLTIIYIRVSGKNGKVGKNGTFSILGLGVGLGVQDEGLGLEMGILVWGWDLRVEGWC